MMRFGHDAGAPVNRLTVHVQALGLRGALCSEQKRRGAMPGATEAVLDRGDWRATPVPCSCLAETTRDRAGSAQGMMLASAGQHHAASAGAGAVRGHAGVLKLLEKLRHGLRVGDTKLEKLQTRCGPRARSAAPRDPATRGRGPAWAGVGWRGPAWAGVGRRGLTDEQCPGCGMRRGGSAAAVQAKTPEAVSNLQASIHEAGRGPLGSEGSARCGCAISGLKQRCGWEWGGGRC